MNNTNEQSVRKAGACTWLILIYIYAAHVYFILFFSIPFIIFALRFFLPPSPNSDPGSHSRLFPLPTHYGSFLAFFIKRRFQLFLPSSTRVELCLPTLGALRGFLSFFFFFCKYIQNCTSKFHIYEGYCSTIHLGVTRVSEIDDMARRNRWYIIIYIFFRHINNRPYRVEHKRTGICGL